MFAIFKTANFFLLTNKKAPEGAIFKNGADSGILLELFNETLHPILTSGRMLPLYFEIENYISGVEK